MSQSEESPLGETFGQGEAQVCLSLLVGGYTWHEKCCLGKVGAHLRLRCLVVALYSFLFIYNGIFGILIDSHGILHH